MSPAQSQEEAQEGLAKLPTNRRERKSTPIWSGFINYFPLAIAAVSQLSHSANEVHNPGQPLHWSKGKSNDHRDCMGRHLIEIDEYDTEPDHDFRYLHAVKNAWRAMAYLQTLLEAGKPPRISASRTPANDDVQIPAGSVIPEEIFYADLSAEWVGFAEHQRDEYRVQRLNGATMEDALREARIHRETVVVSSESFIERWHALSERQKNLYWKLLGTARTEQAQDRALLAAERAQWCTAAR